MTKMLHALFQVSSENGADPTWISVGAYGVAQNGRPRAIVPEEHVHDVLDHLGEIAADEDVEEGQAPRHEVPGRVRERHLGEYDEPEHERRKTDRRGDATSRDRHSGRSAMTTRTGHRYMSFPIRGGERQAQAQRPTSTATVIVARK